LARGERTAEERERDRQERERRRAERSGDPPPSDGRPPAPEQPQITEPPAAGPSEPPPTEPLEVLAPAPAPAPEQEPGPDARAPSEAEEEPWPAPWPEPEPPPEPAAPEPAAPEPAAPEHPAAEREAPEPVAAEPPSSAVEEPQPERPSEREAAYSRIGKPPPPISSAGRRSRRPAAGLPVVAPAAGEKGRPHVSRLVALIALGAVMVAVVVAVVSLSSKSKPRPPAPPAVVRVLIPEGKTRAQIAVIAMEKGLTGSYRKDSEHSPLIDPASYGAPRRTPDLEGFLFPATYELDKHAPALRLVEEQLAAFTEHFGPPQIARAKALHVTPYQLLTVASMVEREAQVPGDRAKIAAVIYNRLARNMPLGIDASIYYAVELEKNIPTYTKELTEAQLHIDSPYNTRLHTGLPPTPISNPGAASIEAAAHPARVGYLYYVAGADGCGEQVFSESQSVFETDVAAYKAAVAKNGGHPPVCKKK
jgi:cell division protein YceG involved in septum cleavage